MNRSSFIVALPGPGLTVRAAAALLLGALAAFAPAGSSSSAAAESPVLAPLVLKGNDPIRLAAGEEIAGSPERSIVHRGFEYRFAAAATLDAFRSDPERYAVRFGGACLKMGPLAGGGSPDRWEVHEGRLYLFASESCRDAFRAEPERYIDRADSPPTGTDAERARAAEILDRAVEALGGREALAKLESIETKRRHRYQGKEKVHVWTTTESRSFPGRLRLVEEADGYRGGWTLGTRPEESTLSWGESERPAAPDVHDYMTRVALRDPLALLKAWRAGAATAYARGTSVVGGIEVNDVAIGVGGATTVLGIDPRSGRVLRAAYRGRAVRGISEVVVEYGAFRDVGGYSLPHAAEIHADGLKVENPVAEIVEIRINPGQS